MHFIDIFFRNIKINMYFVDEICISSIKSYKNVVYVFDKLLICKALVNVFLGDKI